MGMASSKSRSCSRSEIAEPLTQEGPDRVAQEALQLVEADRVAVARVGSGRARNGAARRAGASAARAPARCSASKLHGPSGTERAGLEVPGVEGLQGVRDDDVRRAAGPSRPRTVRSTTSSSSPTGTAGGRGRLERSSRPV